MPQIWKTFILEVPNHFRMIRGLQNNLFGQAWLAHTFPFVKESTELAKSGWLIPTQLLPFSGTWQVPWKGRGWVHKLARGSAGSCPQNLCPSPAFGEHQGQARLGQGLGWLSTPFAKGSTEAAKPLASSHPTSAFPFPPAWESSKRAPDHLNHSELTWSNSKQPIWIPETSGDLYPLASRVQIAANHSNLVWFGSFWIQIAHP